MPELPDADLTLLPALREAGGEVGREFEDVFVGFRVRFRDDHEAFAFSQHFRFAATRAALRQEGGGVVWIGFHAWAFDADDAQLQAALAVRYSAVRARLRHIPVATDAEVRPSGRRLLQPARARAERDAFLARLDDPIPDHMLDTQRAAMGSPARRAPQLPAGRWPVPGAPGRRASSAPPGSGAATGSAGWRRWRRRLLGR
jgi:hypothetical protein